MYKNMNENHQLFQDFPGFDRFDYPEGTYRVTAGMGGEAILVIGSRYTALYDTGMAYCAEGTISNIKTVLHRHQRTRLDYILVSHTHYDHIGALPYVLKEWPDAIVCGAAKAMMVSSSSPSSPSAIDTEMIFFKLLKRAFSSFDLNRPIILSLIRVGRNC